MNADEQEEGKDETIVMFRVGKEERKELKERGEKKQTSEVNDK